jgi:hydrogenase expression/formation protein HypC
MPKAGDWVLIHVGFAMSKISEQDAMEQMRLLRALGETEQAMEEVRGYGLENDVGHEGLSQWKGKPNA